MLRVQQNGLNNADAIRDLFRHGLVPQHSDSLDLDFDNVAGLEQHFGLASESDAGRRAGEDHVTGFQRADAGDVGDELVDRKNQLLRVGVLHRLAIQTQLYVELPWVADFVAGD